MKPAFDFLFPAQRSLLLTASILVPHEQREEWRREWLAELWHVRRSLVSVDETLSWEAQCEMTSFCLGAFPDAFCIRRQFISHGAPVAHLHGSAGQALLWLSAAVAICCVIARLLPGVNAENEASRFPIKSNVLLISEAASTASHPAIPTKLIHNWQKTPQRFFDDLAFYSVSSESVQTSTKNTHWNVAHSTANLFALLGVPILAGYPEAAESDLPAAVLSHETWLRSFAGDPHIAGRIVRTGLRKVRIAGVAPAAGWTLPGAPDVWLLESETQLAADSSSNLKSYLFAQLSDRGLAALSGSGTTISARDLDDMTIDLSGAPVVSTVVGCWNLYEFALFLAVVALPAVVSVSLGESGVSSHRPSAKQRACRVLFLAAKLILIAALGLYASLDLAYFSFNGYSPAAECLQVLACFTICLAGFRWAIADQRKRCPVCLRRVTNPATVGLASRTFLGWNGTELICMGGHALLHVPSHPTSWFGDQRWLYLDSSWDFLFSDSYVY